MPASWHDSRPQSLALNVEPAAAGSRLDHLLARQLDFSRARLQRWLKAGLVLVNGQARPPSYKVRSGDAISVAVPEPAPSHLLPESLPLKIVYEDRDLLVVNKPPGLVTHPGAGHRTGTLLNALLHHCPDLEEIGDISRPGLVHRLDKDTSGLLVVAKTDLAHRSLISQFQKHAVKKKYLALVWGRLPQKEGRIAREIGRHPTERQKMSVHARRGKEAVTLWRVLKEFPGPLTLVEFIIETGRTHQIRVHMTAEGHPILGDATYGGGASRLKSAPPALSGLKTLVKRQMLHAWQLRFTHPRSGEEVGWEAALPGDFQGVVDFLEGCG
ncbi:MAG: RluA family pseudouridine synthase [Syntrophales bacterium]|nr:RluA family pseudouridine synthase [Syntrophales bacterium]MDD5642951.1 RluA family pseudouridine synthase [Syntrophales bacterium]